MKVNGSNNLFKITAPAFEKYLLLNGWKREYDFANQNLMVFNYNDRRISIPASEKFDDFYFGIENILEMLSFYNKKDLNDIVYDIISSYTERMEFRIISKLSEDGKLPFGYASNCIEGLKDLILYSACAENNKSPVCVRTTNIAKEVLDNFKMAQTEVGSFIINIETAIGDEGTEQLTFDECNITPPLEHKVIDRIYTAIKQVDEVASEKTSIENIIADGYETGITANMCDAFLKLKPEYVDAEIQTTIRYASAITRSLGNSKVINFKNKHFYIIDEIAKKYRETEKFVQATLSGYINTLKKNSYEDQKEKHIGLTTLIDGKLRNIKIFLNDFDYRIACDAHRDQEEVEVSGILDMNNRIWEMQQVDIFKII